MTSHPLNPDLLRVRDILNAIEDATAFHARGFDDRARLFGAAYMIAIIGEACSRISPGLREKHPEVPWNKAINTRHKIIHEYGKLDIEILRAVIAQHLPPLKTQMLAILAELESTS